ncbi:MFS transporter [Alkalihalobacillus trypoxylicola]|uniref:Major facilitator superfamily (MFS) profile domain-containing protein n=1 Tax=Alkalihalobacillus trypoxylicola TaxID=519424 RepID=A0A162DGQ7_9BACI|nr:MFS transporter [Alkalihalobacillus trypoxylicola]KYG29576.1 hypothetical protein AZF04_08655 [Alkalihalobacillus trypoxylicola]
MRHFHPTIRIRLFLQFISSLSTMAVLPYLIIYFSGQLGNMITGILFICVMFSNVLGSILGGYVSDRIGRKKIIVLAELFIVLGYTGAALANYTWGTFPYVTFVFFIVIQFSNGMVNPVYQALVIDVSSPNERKTIYTYSYWLRNLGVAIGSIVGAFLFMNHLFLLLIGVAFTTMLSLLITLLFIKETYRPSAKQTKSKANQPFSIGKEYLHILKHRFFAIFLLSSSMIIMVEEQLTNYIGVRLANEIPEPVSITNIVSFEVDGINLLGILKTENTIIIVCFTLLLMKIIKSWNERFTLMTGLFLFFVGYSVISFSTSPLLLLIAMLIASIGEMMYIPIQQTILANIVPDYARSTYMALYSIAVMGGVSVAGVFLMMSNWFSPVILTIIISWIGMTSLFLFFQLTSKKAFLKAEHKAVG